MNNEQILIGGVTAFLCLIGLINSRWLLSETRKGQRLIQWFGEPRALLVLRGLLSAGIAFGILLAVNIIRPFQW